MQSVLYHQRKYTSSLKAAVEGSALTFGHNSKEKDSTQTLARGHGMDDPESVVKLSGSGIESNPQSVSMECISEKDPSMMTPAISSSAMTQIQLTKVRLMFYTEPKVLFLLHSIFLFNRLFW